MGHAEDALTAGQKHTLRAEQKRIRAIAEGKTSLDALTLEPRLQRVHAQERINATMIGTRCRRHPPGVPPWAANGQPPGWLHCTTVGQDNFLREMADRDADGTLLTN